MPKKPKPELYEVGESPVVLLLLQTITSNSTEVILAAKVNEEAGWVSNLLSMTASLFAKMPLH
jgi:hypothetical protein